MSDSTEISDIENGFKSLGESFLNASVRNKKHYTQIVELILSNNNQNEAFSTNTAKALKISEIAVHEIGVGVEAIIAFLLAMCSNFQKTKIEDHTKKFGKEIGIILEGIEKIKSVTAEPKNIQEENFRKLLLNLANDVRVILIQLAIHLEKMRRMQKVTEAEQLKLAQQAFLIYAPLAHRLGLYLIKSEMEDLYLKFSDRKTYSFIAKKLAEKMKARKAFIGKFIDPIEESLKKHGFKFEIKGRPKSIFSIWNKMKKKEVEFEDIYDLFAIRIILHSAPENEKADCWQVYSMVTDLYQPNPTRLRDWISIPKSNGYESLHTTVIGSDGRWVEVQIRTERMNEIAEKGFAAHWKYKGQRAEHGLDEWLTNIREMLESPQPLNTGEIDEFKLSLYSKEIFVFTPKGDLKQFPQGATVLDFAYDIHSDVGDSCMGAKVNGKNVPIRFKLNNGDRVEIITSKAQTPKLDWLNLVETSKAKTKIKQKLNEERAKEAEIGKEIVKRRFKNWRIEYSDENIRKLLKHYKCKTSQDLYYLVSLEKIEITELKLLLTEELNAPDETAEDILKVKTKQINNEENEDFLYIDENMKNVDYKLAPCCSPVFGDRIFGFVTVNDGIKIHRFNCPNATQLQARYNYRIVQAKWKKSQLNNNRFPADINIKAESNGIILKAISSVVEKDLKVNLVSFNVTSIDGGLVEGRLRLTVRNVEHLDSLIARIKKLKGVYNVSRVENFM